MEKSPYWRVWHDLQNATDADDLPDPDKINAAAWMEDMRLAFREIIDKPQNADTIARGVMHALDNRTRIFPFEFPKD